jgi:dihydrofolate reductase
MEMRKVIASTFISLDGFIVGPNEDISWVTKNFNDEMGVYAGNLQSTMSAILLGRVTYHIMTNAWPSMTEETSPGAERMNNVPKIIFSRTLDKVEWGKYNNARLVKNNAAQEVLNLKEQPGGDMVIYGSANLIQNFIKLDLIDEFQLLVHPVVLGSGKPLFKGLEKPMNLKLLRTETFKNGVVVLYYQPERK